jgi:hypothetical protein
MIRHLTAAAVLLTLGGCAMLAPAPTPLPPQKGAESVEITKQQNGRFIAFVSPRLQHTEPFLGVAGTNFFALRSWLDTKTGEAAHQLYVADSYYGGPYRWDGAHGSDNRPLRFIAVGRNEIICEAGCSYFDEFAAALPEDLLKSHQNGLAVTFTANNNGKSLTIDVPGKVVTEELAAVDTVRAALPRADAAPPTTPGASGATPVAPPTAIAPAR